MRVAGNGRGGPRHRRACEFTDGRGGRNRGDVRSGGRRASRAYEDDLWRRNPHGGSVSVDGKAITSGARLMPFVRGSYFARKTVRRKGFFRCCPCRKISISAPGGSHALSGFVVREGWERSNARDFIKKLGVRTPSQPRKPSPTCPAAISKRRFWRAGYPKILRPSFWMSRHGALMLAPRVKSTRSFTAWPRPASPFWWYPANCPKCWGSATASW